MEKYLLEATDNETDYITTGFSAFKKGLAIDEIKEITGLNDDEIEEIRKGFSS